MKELVILAMTTVVLAFAPKQTLHLSDQADRYCAKVKDGKIVVMHDGMVLNSDVKLPNGVQVNADASVIDKDGIKRFLREGECVNKEGKSIDPK
ncbi:MAG: hypothetical protein K0S33_1942 [Bacteroidetes bacterium]|jgi:hypothetical protein|nr:hypothetical protein [Bacteroidota bacterium]